MVSAGKKPGFCRLRWRGAPAAPGPVALAPDPEVERTAATERSHSYRRGGSDYLLRGLIWLGVGIALSVSDNFFGTGNHIFGWIASAVGVAYLSYYGLEGRREGPPPGSGGPPPVS